MEPEVLYLDNHLLVINKQAGVPVQADQTGDQDLLTLARLFLKEKFDKPGNVFLGLVHRLDRPVSGVLVFARTSKAASRLSEQFRKRTPTKRYLALVEGLCSGEGTCIDYLVKEKRQVRVVDRQYPGAQEAILTFRVLDSRHGMSLLEVQLETGRSHQIRVQLAHRGMPIIGDFRYGTKVPFDGRNLALHCYSLQVLHPTRGDLMEWTAMPPATWGSRFASTINRLCQKASNT